QRTQRARFDAELLAARARRGCGRAWTGSRPGGIAHPPECLRDEWALRGRELPAAAVANLVAVGPAAEDEQRGGAERVADSGSAAGIAVCLPGTNGQDRGGRVGGDCCGCDRARLAVSAFDHPPADLVSGEGEAVELKPVVLEVAEWQFAAHRRHRFALGSPDADCPAGAVGDAVAVGGELVDGYAELQLLAGRNRAGLRCLVGETRGRRRPDSPSGKRIATERADLTVQGD